MKQSCALSVATMWLGVAVAFVLTRRSLMRVPIIGGGVSR